MSSARTEGAELRPAQAIPSSVTGDVPLAASARMDDSAVTQHSARLERMTGSIIAGKYYILELLGEGGMGQVYKARHMSLDRLVCVKILRAELNENTTIVGRFEREAKSASRLRHPNSIQILDFGSLDKAAGFYIVMEFVEGRDLATLLNEEWPLPEARVCHIISQVLSALAAAHSAQVIHRDLKPENIMLEHIGDDPDFVKVLDFGVAKVLAPELPGLTRGDLVCGTPQYMSPEQATGAPIDARADLYAVGVILYRIVTGVLPFEGRNPMDFLTKHAGEKPMPPRMRRPDVVISAGMEALILRAMEKDPARRPQTAEEFRRDIVAIQHVSSVEPAQTWGAASAPPPYGATPDPVPPPYPYGTPPPQGYPPAGYAPPPVPVYGYQPGPMAPTMPGSSPFKRDVQADARRARRERRIRLARNWAIFLSLAGAAWYFYPTYEQRIPDEWKKQPGQWYAWALAQWDDFNKPPAPPPAPVAAKPTPPPAPPPEPPPPVPVTPPHESHTRVAESDTLPDTPDDSNAKPDDKSDSSCPLGMVLVAPARGDSASYPFCIDRYEYPNTAKQLPRVMIDWNDARADCNRARKRLCTAEEWERACRGPRHREYSGTNSYNPSDPEGCNGADNHGRASRIDPSGMRTKCLSGYAVYDMSGNAAEWTATPGFSEQERVVMGGNTEGGPADLRCSARSAQPKTTIRDVIGFRCCSDTI